MHFRIGRRFGAADAVRLRQAVQRMAPLREVEIDFNAARAVEDTALLVIADLMKDRPGCAFRLKGLTHHRRRLLAYMGAPVTVDTPATAA